jgi:hypothetical protein
MAIVAVATLLLAAVVEAIADPVLKWSAGDQARRNFTGNEIPTERNSREALNTRHS